MNAPRLAVFVLCAVLAPAFARAGESWDPVLENGSAWKAVSFTDENGQPRHYWFRANATGDVKLYSLTYKPNDAVTGGAYYESVASAYSLKVGRTRPARGAGSPIYTITREGTSLSLPGTESGTLAASDWDRSHPPTYEDVTVRGTKQKRRTNPMPQTGVQVLVAAPGDKAETLEATPMTNYTAGVGPQSWDDYYFVREPRAPGRGSNPDAAYAAAKGKFQAMHRRILPFEVIFNPDQCFVVPERCADAAKPEYKRYITAGEQAKMGNLLPTEQLATEAHADYVAKVTAFKATLANASETEFGREETLLLQRLLANTNSEPQFQSGLAAVRGKPDQMKLFVRKWRTYLIAEMNLYLVDAEKAGNKEVDFAKAKAGLLDRAKTNAAAPLSAPGRNTPAGADPFTTVLNKTTPVGQWYVFDAVPKGQNMLVTGGRKEVYCHMGTIGMSPIGFIGASAGKPFECVTLKGPVPPVATGVLKATYDWHGSATFDAAAAVTDARKATMTFRRAAPSIEELTLSNGRPMGMKFATATSFNPTSGPVTAAPTNAGTAVAPVVAATVALTDKEKAWLTKDQKDPAKGNLAAGEPAAARAAIIVNLDKQGDAYKGAVAKADAKGEDIDKALQAAKPWGADNKAVVAESGPNADIQLTPEEWGKLDKNSDAYKAYQQVNIRWRGNRAKGPNPDSRDEKPEFKEAEYDGIALHNAVLKFRQTAAPAGSTPKPRDAKPLTADERKLLSPDELAAYTTQEKFMSEANVNPATRQAFEEMTADLRAKTAARKTDAAYDASKITKDNFDKLPDWQKRKYCQELPPSQASVTGDRRPGEMAANGTDAKTTLIDLNGRTAPDANNAGTTAATTTGAAWTDAACAAYKGPAGSGQQVGNRPNVTGTVPPAPTQEEKKLGDDKEVPGKEKSKWLTQDLLTSGAKGAMVGLLVGSLFGPAGLIIGPLVGGALFYGLTKITTKDE